MSRMYLRCVELLPMQSSYLGSPLGDLENPPDPTAVPPSPFSSVQPSASLFTISAPRVRSLSSSCLLSCPSIPQALPPTLPTQGRNAVCNNGHLSKEQSLPPFPALPLSHRLAFSITTYSNTLQSQVIPSPSNYSINPTSPSLQNSHEVPFHSKASAYQPSIGEAHLHPVITHPSSSPSQANYMALPAPEIARPDPVDTSQDSQLDITQCTIADMKYKASSRKATSRSIPHHTNVLSPIPPIPTGDTHNIPTPPSITTSSTSATQRQNLTVQLDLANPPPSLCYPQGEKNQFYTKPPPPNSDPRSELSLPHCNPTISQPGDKSNHPLH